MIDSKTFFGIGAQKAGTTWLYQVLSAYPDCAPLPIKEMHFFDRKYSKEERPTKFLLDDFKRLAHLSQRSFERVEETLAEREVGIYEDGFLRGAHLAKQMDRIVRLAERLTVSDSASYVRYVEDWRLRAGGKLVGEITPAYSTLPVEGFREIETLYPNAHYIFIMRDPVGRFWSQLRFWLAQRGRASDPNAMLQQALKREDFAIRSDYKRTIEVLEGLVPAARIHYAFFEDLVSRDRTVDELRRLEAFLGLSQLDAQVALQFVETPANASPKKSMSDESLAALRTTLAPTYRFVRDKFGSLPPSWQTVP